MKQLFTIKSLFTALSFMSFLANAQCPTVLTPSIITNGYNGEATIESHFDITPTFGKLSYNISGAPGSYSAWSHSMINPVTIYNIAGGSYTLCVTADSLNGGCPLIMGCIPFISNVPVCNASFTYSTDSACVTHFVNTSTGPSLQHEWEINGNYYNTTNVDVTLPDGNYSVSLINQAMVAPSTYVACDTALQFINIACNAIPCSVNASFNLIGDTANTGNFYLYNTSTGNGELTYVWDFGDATPLSTQTAPVHQYAIPGQYVVCFTVTSTNTLTGSSCSDSYCDSSSVHRMAAGFLMSKITVVPSIITGVKAISLFSDLKTYPNPMSETLTIELELNTKEILNYTIVDAFGKTILRNSISESKTAVNTNALAKGFYILSLTDSNGNTLKAIKLAK